MIGYDCTVQLQISNSNAGFINVFTCEQPAAALPGHSAGSPPLYCCVVLYSAPTTTPREQSELAQTEVVKQLLTISEDENCSNSDSHEVIA